MEEILVPQRTWSLDTHFCHLPSAGFFQVGSFGSRGSWGQSRAWAMLGSGRSTVWSSPEEPTDPTPQAKAAPGQRHRGLEEPGACGLLAGWGSEFVCV